MTPERLAEIKREFEWHPGQLVTSATVQRLCQYGMEVMVALEEVLQRLADARGGPGGGTTE